MVNATTLRDHVDDESCILQAGDHHCIHHASAVYYKDAREWWRDGPTGYDALLASNQIVPRNSLDTAVLRRVQNGALLSDFFKRKYIARVQNDLV